MPFKVGGRQVGGGAPCLVIAEAGVNHNGERQLAFDLVDAAADAGADVVKFQTFNPALLASAAAPKAEYQDKGDASPSQREMLEKLALPAELHSELKRHAEGRGLLFMSSPFDEGSADFLASVGVPAFKLPSGEVTNHPFLTHVARHGLPMLMSTGMCTLEEVKAAVDSIRAVRTVPLALFHCVSNYPAAPEDCNLNAMASMRRDLDVPVGWSDHTLGIDISIAAVALGAELIEKHLTTDRKLSGPDHAASLEPREFKVLVEAVRRVERALGDGVKRPRPAERAIADVARKSLHWKTALDTGAQVRADGLVALRPGTGISPARLGAVVGRTLVRAVAAGSLVREEDFAP